MFRCMYHGGNLDSLTQQREKLRHKDVWGKSGSVPKVQSLLVCRRQDHTVSQRQSRSAAGCEPAGHWGVQGDAVFLVASNDTHEPPNTRQLQSLHRAV